jgi:transcriptional regulator with XRE-family HTH domain
MFAQVSGPASSLMATKRERIPHVDDPGAVGRRLVEAREARALSQRDLAFPGCSAAYISRIERGERVPSLQVLRELARRCLVSEAHLAWGNKRRPDPDVVERMRDVETAESSGSKAERADAYAALARAASRAGRALKT